MDNNQYSRCRLPDPYPNVPPLPPNPEAARMLLSAYAAPVSELSSVLQYFYNSELAPLADEAAIGDLFRCVQVVEEHHMELLAGLILNYGGDPGYLYYPTPDRTSWWTGANVVYDKNPVEMLQQGIRIEELTIENYRRIANALRDPSAKALLQRIAADEERHIALFTQALKDLNQ